MEPGDKVHPGDPVTVDRYTAAARINHWITAASLVLLAISGLAALPSEALLPDRPVRRRAEHARDPSLDRRGAVLRLPRPVHPLLAGRTSGDRRTGPGCARIYDVLTDHEEHLPEVGKYNAGQKMVFWMMSILIIVLISSGLVLWDEYFFDYTTIEQKRVAVLIHSHRGDRDHLRLDRARLRGDLGARDDPGMVEGRVTGGWAWRHHRKWLRELVTGKSGDQRHGSDAGRIEPSLLFAT